MLVCQENYTYRRERDDAKKTKSYWVCTFDKCPSRMHTEYGVPNIIKQINDHMHPTTKFEVREREFNIKIKEEATKSALKLHMH